VALATGATHGRSILPPTRGCSRGLAIDPLALDNGVVRGVAIFLFVVASGLTSFAAPLSLWLVAGVLALAAAVLWRLSETPNPLIERTSSGKLRLRAGAAHLER